MRLDISRSEPLHGVRVLAKSDPGGFQTSQDQILRGITSRRVQFRGMTLDINNSLMQQMQLINE
jgi:hypothetical protein